MKQKVWVVKQHLGSCVLTVNVPPGNRIYYVFGQNHIVIINAIFLTTMNLMASFTNIIHEGAMEAMKYKLNKRLLKDIAT